MTNYSTDGEDVLEQARYDIFRHLLPIIICMIVSGAAGIVGNILTIIFYAFKTKRATTVVLIACLAVVDLTVCVLFIPNIAEMWVNVKYTQSVVCKLAHFIGLWAVACSGLILWVVAIDRHRKICSPFGKQMTLTMVRYAVIGIVVFGFFLSVRNFANFDTVEVGVAVHGINETVRGHYCTTRDDSSYITSVTVFTVIDFLLMLMVWFTLAIAYSHIIYTLFKLKKTRKQIQRVEQVADLKISNPSYDMSETANHSYDAQNTENEIHETEGHEESGRVPPADKHVTIHENSDKISIGENELISEPLSEYKRRLSSKQLPETSTSAVEQNQKQKNVSNGSQQNSESPEAVILRVSSGTRDTQISADYSGQYSSSRASEILPDGGTLSSDSQNQLHSQKKTTRRKHGHYRSAKSAREMNLTFKMLTVSIVFICCFTPYFIVKILMREVLKTGEEYELSLWSQIGLRLPYMNSVFNPIVYCVFNPQFRLYIKGVFSGICSKSLFKTKYSVKS